MNLRELIEQSDKRPITPASIDADADVMMYLWANRHAICELIEAAKKLTDNAMEVSAKSSVAPTDDFRAVAAVVAKLGGKT